MLWIHRSEETSHNLLLYVGSIGRFHKAIFHDFMIHEGMLLPIASNFRDAPSLDMASLLQPMQGPPHAGICHTLNQTWSMPTFAGKNPRYAGQEEFLTIAKLDTKFNTILGESFGFFKSHVCLDNCRGSKILHTNIYLASAEHLA